MHGSYREEGGQTRPSPARPPHPPLFLCIFPRRSSLSGGFLSRPCRDQSCRSRSAYCGADTRSPWAGARGGGSGCGGTPGPLPRAFPLARGISSRAWEGVFFFGFILPPRPVGRLFPPLFHLGALLCGCSGEGESKGTGHPPPTPNPPRPATAPLFACHVYNLVETKTDICGREKMTFTSPDHSLK